MAQNSFYADQPAGGPTSESQRTQAGNPGNTLPVVSTDLDSVRSYQFEVRFDLATVNVPGIATDTLTLAAKQVTGIGYNLQDIEVHRMNDRLYYPGKVQQEELTITFDNLLRDVPTQQLFEYLATVFDMRTGFYSQIDGSFKTSMQILEFDGQGRVVQVIDLKGVYPKSFVKGEKNYATSEFDTLEVKFRYDFMNVRTIGSTSVG
jgi:hypothetical protein